MKQHCPKASRNASLFLIGRWRGAAATEGSGTPQFGIVVLRLRTALHFACAVFRGCALRFASCARHSSPSGLRCSQARLQFSLPHWGLRTGLRFAGPVFRGCGALRAVPQFSMVVPLRSQARLRHSLLHWAYFGLFRALRAASVRPSPLHPFGASTGLLRPVSATDGGLRAPLSARTAFTLSSTS